LRRWIRHAGRDRSRDIAHINRLKTRVTTTDQGKRRQQARKRGKAVEEIVLRSEDDRGTQTTAEGKVSRRRISPSAFVRP